MGHHIKTTHKQILDYWNDNPHLIDNLFLDIDNDTSQRLKKNIKSIIKNKMSLCWGCFDDTSLDRCHINARQHGGNDDPSNLILLCRICHKKSPDTKDQTLDDILKPSLIERIELENFSPKKNGYYSLWIDDFGMNGLQKCAVIKKLELYYNISYPHDLMEEYTTRMFKEMVEDCMLFESGFDIRTPILHTAFGFIHKTCRLLQDHFEELALENQGIHHGKTDLDKEVNFILSHLKELQSVKNFKDYYIKYLDSQITMLSNQELEFKKKYLNKDYDCNDYEYENFFNILNSKEANIKKLLFFRKYYGEKTRNYIDNNTQVNSIIEKSKKNLIKHLKQKSCDIITKDVIRNRVGNAQKIIDSSKPYEKCFV
jgi:hypothetical protein